MTRAVGVDLGSVRIGVAVAPADTAVAVPYEVLERSGERAQDHEALAGMVAEVGAEVVVVGLPTSLDGTEGPAAAAVRTEADEIAAVLDVPVVLHDERYTTVSAERMLAEQGVRGPARRKVIDKVAAAVILQSWLDARD
ncbi:Holliday junction resolvase RuvX [Candidatus Poriferisodalis sp.]|uniref:Holliday junction resolvase RuvX n=1 Tax=Candidatus Poriferisodalis sp. TaxID=3101277 RepID=UPI003B02C863